MARLLGAIGLVVVTALLFWLLTDDAFRVTDERITFRGLAHADEAEVRDYLSDIDRGPNVFRVRATDIVSELSTLPAVDAAWARVTLPADVRVTLDERDPVFIWSNGQIDWLVDEEGMLFAPGAEAAETDEAVDQASQAARADLPVIEDSRIVEPPAVGSFLPVADLAAMRQLLAITPELLDSTSSDLHLRIDERDGYVLESRDLSWRALFGHYTPSVQPPAVIPTQVQCLRWLLATEERRLGQVRLVPSDDGCGTFTRRDAKPRKRE
jgi:cell division septal protein FtsQ